MKLMKFLVVALVAGSVCAPVASQTSEIEHMLWLYNRPAIKGPPRPASEIDGKAVMCRHESSFETFTDEEKRQGLDLKAYVFGQDIRDYDNRNSPAAIGRVMWHDIDNNSFGDGRRISLGSPPWGSDYRTTLTQIIFGDWGGGRPDSWSLDRKTLVLTQVWKGETLRTYSCWRIDPDEVRDYLQKYIDYGNAFDDKIRAENKI